VRRLALVAGVVAVLVGAGEVLPAPPLDVARWPAWIEDLGPVAAALALVRATASVAAAWVAAAATITAAATWAGAPRAASLAGRALPAPLRRAAAGVGVASAVVLGSAPAAVATPPPGEPLVLLPDDGTATMRVLPAEAEEDAEEPPAPVPAPAPAPTVEDTWTVAPGDSFWSIAADIVGDALGRAPTDAEVDGYWRALVDANRDRLVSPNPDLVLPGQVFVLPAR
jgi:hypothetical protein